MVRAEVIAASLRGHVLRFDYELWNRERVVRYWCTCGEEMGDGFGFPEHQAQEIDAVLD